MHLENRTLCLVVLYGVILMNVSIYGLVVSSHRELRRLCINTGLWEYVFINTVFVLLYILSKNKVPLDNMQCYLTPIIILLVYLMIIILWGVYELVNPCLIKYLTGSMLYNIAIGWVVFYLCIIMLVLVGLIFLTRSQVFL